MTRPLRLASSSQIRLNLLQAAGVQVTSSPVHLDEATIRQSLEQDNASPRDIADALAEMKAQKAAYRHPADLVLGCDQVLAFDNVILSKPSSLQEARAQLLALRGQTHRLLSAAVLFDAGLPVWRVVGEARLTMRAFSDEYLEQYLARNWPDIADSVGAYKLEHEGVRLFDKIDGDYFTILGLPLLPLLSFLTQRGFLTA